MKEIALPTTDFAENTVVNFPHKLWDTPVLPSCLQILSTFYIYLASNISFHIL
ncbi:MAG: hypothetical protein ACLR8N_04100 [Lachnospiraceae bacterium]